MIGYHAGHTAERALHDRIAKTVAGIRHAGLCLRHLCLSRQESLLSSLQFEVANNLLVAQLFLAVVVELSRRLGRLGRLEGSLSCVEGCLIRHLIDDEECLSLVNLLPFCGQNLRDESAHLRPYLHNLLALHGGAILRLDRLAGAFHLHRLIDLSRLLCLLFLAGSKHDEPQHKA